MCNSSGVLQGFAILTLDCMSGVPTYLYQSVDSTSTTSTRPGTWFPCCTESSAAGSHPMYTDGSDLSTLAGYVFIRFDSETSVYQQQWVTVGGVITTTRPSGWEQGACGATDSGGGSGDVSLTVTDKDIIVPLMMVPAGTANITWTDMPLAEDAFNGSIRTSLKMDLTNFSHARLVVRKMGTAGAAASKIIAKYSTVNPGSSFTAGDWSNLGASEISCAVNVTNQEVVSSWVALATLAKDDVYLTLTGSGGDGALDPIFGNCYIEFKMPVVTDVTATGGGGGGGGGTVNGLPGSVHLFLPSGTVLDDTKYPDWAVSGLSASARNDTLSIPCNYDGGDWCRLVVSVKNVTGALTADLTVTLKDLTTAVDVATITFPSGTSPTSGELWDDVTIGSGSFVDNTHIQWHIESAEDNNAFGIHAECFYLLTVDAT